MHTNLCNVCSSYEEILIQLKNYKSACIAEKFYATSVAIIKSEIFIEALLAKHSLESSKQEEYIA